MPNVSNSIKPGNDAGKPTASNENGAVEPGDEAGKPVASNGSSSVKPKDGAGSKKDLPDIAGDVKKGSTLPGWVVEMRQEIADCPTGIEGVVCKEQIRWKYCPRVNWEKYKECRVPKTDTQKLFAN